MARAPRGFEEEEDPGTAQAAPPVTSSRIAIFSLVPRFSILPTLPYKSLAFLSLATIIMDTQSDLPPPLPFFRFAFGFRFFLVSTLLFIYLFIFLFF